LSCAATATFETASISSGALPSDAAGVTVALSTSLGNSNHVALAKVIRHARRHEGAEIRVFDTALDAVADVVAGHADVGAITAASSGAGAGGRTAARHRHILAGASRRRLCVVADLGRARRRLRVGSWRGVCGPPGLEPDRVSFWQGLLARMSGPRNGRPTSRHFWTPMHLDGEDLRDYLRRERTKRATSLTASASWLGSPSEAGPIETCRRRNSGRTE
jgi:tripartite-type tricarboxylate transporter receptor subunit TctC